MIGLHLGSGKGILSQTLTDAGDPLSVLPYVQDAGVAP